MAVTINGTTGIAGVDGSASTPAVLGTDTNTGIFFPAADTIAFGEGGAEVARFDSSGNLLVNTTTAQTGAKLAVTGGIQGTITSGTAVASTSGTSIDFTSIPSWVKRITVMFSGVSSSGSSAPIIQIGSGSVSTSGYTSIGVFAGATNTASGAAYTTGFGIPAGNSANLMYGHYVLTLLSSNTWVCSAVINSNVSGVYYNFSTGGVSPNLTNALDRVRITTVNGTDPFDAGTVNILYEG
jgi:hypothetical protein